MDPERIRTEYERIRPLYCDLVTEVQFALENALKARSIKPAAIIGRAKTTESLLDKVDRKNYSDPLQQINDLAGIRVICLFDGDIDKVHEIISNTFVVIEMEDKTKELGVDRMSYQGRHYIVRLQSSDSGARYDRLRSLLCEVQVRNVLQDAWAQLSQNLVYKSENSIPSKVRRQLNNVMSLLEIAQNVFESAREIRSSYILEIDRKRNDRDEFLSQNVDSDTLAAYTKWKYPTMPVDPKIHELLVRDSIVSGLKTLRDIDNAVDSAHGAVEIYQREQPSLFNSGTDHLTKSLGFAHAEFRKTHPFGPTSRKFFTRYERG